MKVRDETAHLLAKEKLIDWMICGEKLPLGVSGGNEKKKRNETC
jgi:hypothetical protein